MKPYYEEAGITLYHADCREVLPLLGSIDLVLTDPPYKTEFLSLFGDLARLSAIVMKPGSILITLCGHFAVDKITALMSPHLRFYWIGGMPNTLGSVAFNHSRQMLCAWKPALWYSKGTPNKHAATFDLFQPTRSLRLNHKWEQPLAWFQYYLNKLTTPADIIVDPFCGSGTTAIACYQLGRKFVGIETEEKHCQTTIDRLRQSVLPFNPQTLPPTAHQDELFDLPQE